VSLEDPFTELLPEVMLGVDAERFAQIAAIAFSPGRCRRALGICTN